MLKHAFTRLAVQSDVSNWDSLRVYCLAYLKALNSNLTQTTQTSCCYVPQTVLALRGSHGVGIEGAMAGLRIRAWTRPLIFVAIYCTWRHLASKAHPRIDILKELLHLS